MSLHDPNVTNAKKRKRVAIVLANLAVSTATGWPARLQVGSRAGAVPVGRSARTREFEELVRARGDAARWDISAEIEEHWNTVYGCVQGNMQQKDEAAVKATSAYYHLLYYSGKNGTLRKIDTSTEPLHKECFIDATPTRDTK